MFIKKVLFFLLALGLGMGTLAYAGSNEDVQAQESDEYVAPSEDVQEQEEVIESDQAVEEDIQMQEDDDGTLYMEEDTVEEDTSDY